MVPSWLLVVRGLDVVERLQNNAAPVSTVLCFDAFFDYQVEMLNVCLQGLNGGLGKERHVWAL